MTGVFDQVKLLFEQQLYSNVVSLASLVLSVSEHNPEMLTASAKFQTYVYFGDSLFYLGQYRKAEGIYRRALQFKKSLLKSKGAAKPQDNQKEIMPDIAEIKYQIHVCNVNLKQNHQAIVVLQSIPGKLRNTKINMALAKLYQQGGMERSAITAYKEVLRECPLALEAAEGLLSLGVKGIEVNALILEGTSKIGSVDWLNSWIKAHAHMYNQEYSQAISTFRLLDDRSSLRDNLNLLVVTGQCYYYMGDHKNALITLQRLYASVLMKDPVTVCKAKSILEKALSQGETYLPAVYLLAEIYEQEMALESAIALLEKQVELQPTCKLHQMLGDLLARVHEEEKALDHYSIALNLDPNNRRALEGMHRIDNSSSKLDTSYYMTVGGEEEGADTTYERIADSENEGEADESETEAVWSDMDLELNSQ